MPTTRSSKRHTVIPNGLSEEEVDSSESEDEISTIKRTSLHESTMSEQSSSSEESDVEEVVQKAPPSKKKKTLNWKKKFFSAPAAAFTDNLPPPPVNEELEPINYFHSMFGKQSITLLSDQSNLYSVQTNSNKPLCISENEMEHFIGVLIMTGIYSFPQQRFFWMNATRVESISSVMSRDRFLQIKKYIHVVDNSSQPNRNDLNFDRAYKVRPLLNIVKENFRKIPKEEKLSVDEQIIPFKGRSIMKQHMPKKPNRWGYKMFVLAGGESGICYDFIFYTGKGDKTEYGFCTNIVLALCETVPRSINHKLYCDNFYTTIQLQVELHKLGIYAVGTVRANRLPGLVMKNDNDLSSEGRGAMDHRVTEVDGVQICAIKWYDNNIVNCLSTLHGCHPIDLVQRWSAKEKKHIQITRPNVIKAYNQHMGGVDLIDMLISLYRINVRSRKYYIKIIFHLIDLSVVNAWLLYRRHCLQLKISKKKTMSLLTFRISIAEALLKSSPSPPSPVKRGRPSLESVTNENSPRTSSRAAPNPLPPTSVRLDKFDHWPVPTVKGRCRNPGCVGQTRISCSKCELRLCLNDKNNCFKEYHN
ncbi:unnamed protein product [Didymodactylos carnosus]|uniref:PiggyBac transposable element-derived protein domain-containing protein n=1 Tax=Didymodactylos carnosus TaxID=1234261 RepID=A0A815ZSR4_9BILA|nr:unnamed protein product [Didymodactylos carnosus]CAF4459901.1 unnamed protein product [Didymodactylos carnosus]